MAQGGRRRWRWHARVPRVFADVLRVEITAIDIAFGLARLDVCETMLDGPERLKEASWGTIALL